MGRVEQDEDWLISGSRTLEMRRRLVFAGRGRLGIAQDFATNGRHESVLATAHYWFASVVTVRAGALGFCDGRGTRLMDAKRFLLYLPAGALVRMPLELAQVATLGITARSVPPGWPEQALAIPCELTAQEALCEKALGAVFAQAPWEPHRIDADCGLPANLRALRRRLYAYARGPAPVGRAALELGMAPAVLSRSFSAAYGLSPRQYCQRVRVHAAAVALLGGLSIVQVGLASGWQDLSRFYRQFRHATGETPGRYRAAGGNGK